MDEDKKEAKRARLVAELKDVADQLHTAEVKLEAATSDEQKTRAKHLYDTLFASFQTLHKELYQKRGKRLDSSRTDLAMDNIVIVVPSDDDILVPLLRSSGPEAERLEAVFQIKDDPESAPIQLLEMLHGAIQAQLGALQGEIAFTTFIDNFLVAPFRILGTSIHRNVSSQHKTTLNRPDLEISWGFYGQEKRADLYCKGNDERDPEMQLINGFDFKVWRHLYSEVPKRPAYTYISAPKNRLTLGFVNSTTCQFEHALELNLDEGRNILVATAWILQQLPILRKTSGNWQSCPSYKQIMTTSKGAVYVSSEGVVKVVTARQMNVGLVCSRLMALAKKQGSLPFVVPLQVDTRKGDLLIKMPRYQDLDAEKMKDPLAQKRAARDITLAVQLLHAQGIVHHDIQMQNVLETKEGSFLLNDFGEADILRNHVIPGRSDLNPLNHSPNVVREHSTDVDIWGLAYFFQELSSDFFELAGMLNAVALRSPYVQKEGEAALKFALRYLEFSSFTFSSDSGFSDQYRQTGIEAGLLCAVCGLYNSRNKGASTDNWTHCDRCHTWRHDSCGKKCNQPH